MEDSPTIAAMDGLKAAALAMADALEAGDAHGFATSLNASRTNHYALHESCDSDVLRTFFTKLAPFILGGKTCGAGGGGFIVVLTRPGAKNRCAETAESLGGKVWPFKLDDRGAVAWEESAWTETEVHELRTLACPR
jgi:galactokinase/mevalonate kinase-like predicted kinase